jgi:hypothetical protein
MFSQWQREVDGCHATPASAHDESARFTAPHVFRQRSDIIHSAWRRSLHDDRAVLGAYASLAAEAVPA